MKRHKLVNWRAISAIKCQRLLQCLCYLFLNTYFRNFREKLFKKSYDWCMITTSIALILHGHTGSIYVWSVFHNDGVFFCRRCCCCCCHQNDWLYIRWTIFTLSLFRNHTVATSKVWDYIMYITNRQAEFQRQT